MSLFWSFLAVAGSSAAISSYLTYRRMRAHHRCEIADIINDALKGNIRAPHMPPRARRIAPRKYTPL